MKEPGVRVEATDVDQNATSGEETKPQVCYIISSDKNSHCNLI